MKLKFATDIEGNPHIYSRYGFAFKEKLGGWKVGLQAGNNVAYERLKELEDCTSFQKFKEFVEDINKLVREVEHRNKRKNKKYTRRDNERSIQKHA
jgi:hypothetical protein